MTTRWTGAPHVVTVDTTEEDSSPDGLLPQCTTAVVELDWYPASAATDHILMTKKARWQIADDGRRCRLQYLTGPARSLSTDLTRQPLPAMTSTPPNPHLATLMTGEIFLQFFI